MLFVEEDAPLVKAWIVKRLENNSDADADVLADYVLALLRHDGDVETIRNLFEEEIPDFLREDAAAFTNDVLRAVEYRSYLPGAPPAPPVLAAPPGIRQPRFPPPAVLPQPASRPDITSPSTALYNPSAPYSTAPPPLPFPQSGSRKRVHVDDDDVDIILNGQSTYGPPLSKQPRRGGFGQRGGRHEDPYHSRNQRGPRSFTAPGSLPYGGSMPLLPPAIDANTIMENIQILQSLLPSAIDMRSPAYSGAAGPQHRKKQRCRDYDAKGFCSRGTSCHFNHTAPYPLPPAPAVVDEYDPNNSALSLPPFGVQQPPAGQLMDFPNFPLSAPTNRREPKKPRRIKGRAPLAAPGPNHDKTKTSIVVQNIPNENFTQDQIRTYFSQFGNIVDVSMQTQNCLATIKFDTWEAANAAWSSPKVIFDNRFVKVFWHKEEGDGEIAPNGKSVKNPTNGGTTNGSGSRGESLSAEPEFDLTEFYRKQVEAQKVHDEKAKKRSEIERERQELEERQKKLYEKQTEARRLLQTKLKSESSQDGSSQVEGSTEDKDNKTSAQTEALKAQLAALEQEANQLGLGSDDHHDDASPWGTRGRGRGRVYRGRGSFLPRAIRGSYGYRGRGGTVESRHAAYAAYSLDNRPKVVALTGADFTIPENDECLRQYLFSIGEFKEVDSEKAATHVTFKDYKTAEKFMFGVSASNSISGIEGKVEAAWAKMPGESAKTADAAMSNTKYNEQSAEKKPDAPSATEANGDGDGDADLEEGEIDNTPDRHDQGDMDYEAGEW